MTSPYTRPDSTASRSNALMRVCQPSSRYGQALNLIHDGSLWSDRITGKFVQIATTRTMLIGRTSVLQRNDLAVTLKTARTDITHRHRCTFRYQRAVHLRTRIRLASFVLTRHI